MRVYQLSKVGGRYSWTYSAVMTSVPEESSDYLWTSDYKLVEYLNGNSIKNSSSTKKKRKKKRTEQVLEEDKRKRKRKRKVPLKSKRGLCLNPLKGDVPDPIVV